MTFSKEIIEVLDYLSGKFGVTIDWTNENVIPYLQQLAQKYINWEITTSIIWIVIAVVCFAIIGFISYKKCEYDVFSVTAVVCLVIIGFQIFDICRCQYFPELQIYYFIQQYI